ncbi:MAG TPA: hypothetical protein ENK44_04580 [Caldithrix abyssi]|uniref:CDP-diacylglycerol--glycerol-3-phosphate 3-phosphatidyltransferase n=1 Tax=Caldithrix abyssi TaxID=187145 RepID=A0A7V4UCR2_CALAY|nr:hypothetical protein [Caldithrix abyssi]
MKIKLKEFFYLSNVLSISRIILAYPLFYLIKLNTEEGNYWLMGLAVFTAATDVLDGYFSRKYNQVTDLGKILDPIADKIAMAFIAIGLILYRGYPLPLVALLLYRDFFILAIGLIGLMRSEKPVMANFWGKLNTVVISISGLLLIFNYSGVIYKIAVVAGYLTIFISGISYLIVGEKLLFEKGWGRFFFRFAVILITAAVLYLISQFRFL